MLALPNVDVNTAYRNGETLLHKCAVAQTPLLFRQLLDLATLDVNAQDDAGCTALMYAVQHMTLPLVAHLLQLPHCDVQRRNKKGQTVADVIKASSTVDENVRYLVNVVYSRDVTTTSETLMSSVSVDEQLKFLTRAVQTERQFPQTLKDDVITQISCIRHDIALQTGGRFGSGLRMRDEHRRKLIALRAYLCEEVTPRDLMSHLVADGVLTDDMVEELLQERTRRRTCEALLALLPLRGDRAYHSLVAALRAEGMTHVAQSIEEYDDDEEAPGDDPGHSSLAAQVASGLTGIDEPFAVIPLRYMYTTGLTTARDVAAGFHNPTPARHLRSGPQPTRQVTRGHLAAPATRQVTRGHLAAQATRQVTRGHFAAPATSSLIARNDVVAGSAANTETSRQTTAKSLCDQELAMDASVGSDQHQMTSVRHIDDEWDPEETTVKSSECKPSTKVTLPTADHGPK